MPVENKGPCECCGPIESRCCDATDALSFVFSAGPPACTGVSGSLTNVAPDQWSEYLTLCDHDCLVRVTCIMTFGVVNGVPAIVYLMRLDITDPTFPFGGVFLANDVPNGANCPAVSASFSLVGVNSMTGKTGTFTVTL